MSRESWFLCRRRFNLTLRIALLLRKEIYRNILKEQISFKHSSISQCNWWLGHLLDNFCKRMQDLCRIEICRRLKQLTKRWIGSELISIKPTMSLDFKQAPYHSPALPLYLVEETQRPSTWSENLTSVKIAKKIAHNSSYSQ